MSKWDFPSHPFADAAAARHPSLSSTVEQYAKDQGLEILDFAKAKDEDKDDLARAHLAKFTKSHGVVMIGKAQEKALSYKGQRKDHGTKVWFEYSRQRLFVTYYYFYILDEDFGLFFAFLTHMLRHCIVLRIISITN